MKNFGEILNFCANCFYKFFKIFQKSLMSRFVLNVFSQPKSWRRHCSTGLERNSCMNFFLMFPPPTKILAPPLYTVYILHIYVVTCVPRSDFSTVAPGGEIPPPPGLSFPPPLEKFPLNAIRLWHSSKPRRLTIPPTTTNLT